MSSEVQRIPPAPRRVAWRRVLGYRWPLLLMTFSLLVYGGLLTWMFFLAHSNVGEDAARLEAGPRQQVTATVTTAVPPTAAPGPAAGQRVEFRFHAAGHDWTGAVDVPAGRYEAGQSIEIEYLAGEPRIHRLLGSRGSQRARWFDPTDAFALIVVPGMLVGLCYLAGVFHLRRVLVHGDVGIAQVLLVRRVRYCLPESFAVAFRFRDHRAKERQSSHWVRAHSALGQRLLTMLRHGTMERVPVLHDRQHPQHCRLVLPDDFSPDIHPVDPAATIRL